MKYTVIIPTMWKAVDQLTCMLQKYDENPLIGEILIVQNAPNIPFSNNYKKVRFLNDGTNLFVNPSWNLGVREAKFDKVIIANDDIYIPEINSLLTLLDSSLRHGAIIGADANCFEQRRERPVNTMKVRQCEGKMGYGFGVFMVMHKKDYIQIPKELRIWFGDTLIYKALDAYVFEAMIQTKMRTTSKTLSGSKILWLAEKSYYNRNIKNIGNK